ncbi:SNW domain-containing protein 1 [Phlyctochytrium bullatum]|nr:SNW domain-containing protein 1 [Phlyctochytrium bullatum]
MATSIARSLPKPREFGKSKWDDDDDDDAAPAPAPQSTSLAVRGPPPYGKRKGFVPRSQQDFGDGGAYPECHVAQYPLDMGRKTAGRQESTLALQTDAEGNLRYDVVLRQGARDGKIIHSTLKDLAEKDVEDAEKLARPSDEEVRVVAERTREALEKLVDTRIKAAQPKNAKGAAKPAGPTYVKYTPASQQGGVGTRIIRMMEAPIDPMEPPRFKHKKVPRGPPSPPVPVMHSPPRKVSAEEQKNWVIPPCISNWKNAKGYTIPLDKRLAADGRGIQDIQINDNFAKLGEALAIADRHAREEVRVRAEMQAKLAAKEKREKEEKLRMLAQRAREERAGIAPSRAAGAGDGGAAGGAAAMSESEGSDSESEEEDDAKVRERDELRREKQRQREREYRMSHMGAEAKAKVASKLSDRDISEKIALGLAQPTVSRDSMFDQRLFNQSAGLSSGFQGDDAYDLYDKPLFTGSSANTIYRPKRPTDGEDADGARGYDREHVDRLLKNAPHRGFQGTEEGVSHDGPVQFEREDDDPFGLESFMESAQKGRGGSSKDGGSTSEKRKNPYESTDDKGKRRR